MSSATSKISTPACSEVDAALDRRPPLVIRRLGVLPYPDAVVLQKTLVARRQAGDISDMLLLVEHPPVITVGVSARHRLDNLLVSKTVLADRGVRLCEAPRGGDITFHGPGQVVGYPILDLRPDRCDVHRYLRDLEDVLIRTVARFGVEAERSPGLTGVWVGDSKLAAIGVRFSRWVTSHGFALNFMTDLSFFDLIRPCGIRDRGVTSLERLTTSAPSLADVQNAVVAEFGSVFGRRLLS